MRSERDALGKLLDIVHEHDLDALTVRVGKATYELVRRAEAPPAFALPANAEAAPQRGGAGSASLLPGQHAGAHYKRVTAPIIGVFYRSPAPGIEPFVEVGSPVEVGQVLCILEAMKLMNEITSDYAGTVQRILPENGALVSLGEELFWIEP